MYSQRVLKNSYNHVSLLLKTEFRVKYSRDSIKIIRVYYFTETHQPVQFVSCNRAPGPYIILGGHKAARGKVIKRSQYQNNNNMPDNRKNFLVSNLGISCTMITRTKNFTIQNIQASTYQKNTFSKLVRPGNPEPRHLAPTAIIDGLLRYINSMRPKKDNILYHHF